MRNFIHFLENKHADQYHGLDDDMPDDFMEWMSNLQAEDWIIYAEEYAKQKLYGTDN